MFRDDGVPIVGMEKFIRNDAGLRKLFQRDNAEWVLSPNSAADGSPKAARARHHGDFDDDNATLRATLARITDSTNEKAEFRFHSSASSKRAFRASLGGLRQLPQP